MNFQGKYNSMDNSGYGWSPSAITAQNSSIISNTSPKDLAIDAHIPSSSNFEYFKPETSPADSILTSSVKRGRPKENRLFQSSKQNIEPYSANPFHSLEVKKAIFQKMQKQSDFIQGKIDENGRREYHCSVPECRKIFYQRAHLNIHLRSHVGYKPFMCQYPGCNKSFTQQGNLRTHERKHTGEKPYKCKVPGCTKSFTQAGNLKTHIRKIHNTEDATLSFEESNTARNGSPTESTQSYMNRLSMMSHSSMQQYDSQNPLTVNANSNKNNNPYGLGHNLDLTSNLDNSLGLNRDNYYNSENRLNFSYNLNQPQNMNRGLNLNQSQTQSQNPNPNPNQSHNQGQNQNQNQNQNHDQNDSFQMGPINYSHFHVSGNENRYNSSQNNNHSFAFNDSHNYNSSNNSQSATQDLNQGQGFNPFRFKNLRDVGIPDINRNIQYANRNPIKQPSDNTLIINPHTQNQFTQSNNYER